MKRLGMWERGARSTSKGKMLLQFICLKHPIVILCILTHGDILRIVFTVLASFHSRFKGSLWAGLPVLSCDALQPQQFSCKPDLLLPFASRQSFIQLYSTPLFPPSDTSHHIPPQFHYFLASLYWAGEKGPRLERRTLHFVSLLQVQVYAAHNKSFYSQGSRTFMATTTTMVSLMGLLPHDE